MIRVDELLEEAQLLHQGGRYQEMIHLLNEAIPDNSTHAELYFLRGVAESDTKLYDAAIDDLTRAIGLKPDFYRAYLHRGINWNLKKKHDKAIKDLDHAIMLRPNSASAYRYLGNVWSDKKEYDTAISNYDKAIELQPDASGSYLERGTAWLRKKEYQNAIEDINKTVALQPDNASAYTNLGGAWFGLKEYDMAIANFKRSISLKYKNGRAYHGLGLAYEAVGEFELASVHFKRAYYFDFDGSSLVAVFRDRFPSPYIVKGILSGQRDKGLEADFSNIQWLLPWCRTWDSYLDHLRSAGYPVTHPERYYSLEALVNYYMGNSVAAYRIFDTKFDSDEYPYPLTLRDQYYLALSALDFNEPDNGLAYAVEQAKAERGDDPVGDYYAGRLLLLDNDPAGAMLCFDRCGDFLPALYGKLAVYQLQEDAAGLMLTAEQIAAAEEGADAGMRFLDGLGPLEVGVDLSFEAMFTDIMQRVYYYELTEEIAEARRLLGRAAVHPQLPFSALLKLAPNSIDG